MSYWSRTVIVPLLVLMAKKPRARNPRGVAIAELFVAPPESVRDWITPARSRRSPVRFRSSIGCALSRTDLAERSAIARDRSGGRVRHRAAQRRRRARRHLPGDGQHGDDVRLPRLSARPSALRDRALARLRKLVVRDGERDYCQPCLSPIWDTGLAGHALMEVGDERPPPVLGRALRLARRASRCLISSAIGRCSGRACGRAAGPSNTPIRIIPISTTPRWWAWRSIASIASAIARRSSAPPNGSSACRAAMAAGRAFDADNTYYLPQPHSLRRSRRAARSADRGRLGALRRFSGQLGYAEHPAVAAAASPICGASRRADGCWFGRWGTNYIYGTWSVLAGAQRRGRRSGSSRDAPRRRLAARRSSARMAAGARTASPIGPTSRAARRRYSTASQTAWALLG